MSRAAWPRSVAVIGTGLIGTSIGLALLTTRRSRATAIAGWDPRPAALRAALRRRGITRAARSLADAVSGADLVVLAAPLEQIVALVPKAIAAADDGALIIDVVGLKKQVVTAARRALRERPRVLFVGGHPMAGREVAGAAHADPSLFAGRIFALVDPFQPARARAQHKAERFVRMLGALPVCLTPAVHDRTVVATSALPQLAAIALAIAVESASGREAKTLAGPGYRDATRLAASPFSMWASVLEASKPALVRVLRHFERVLARVVKAARQSDRRAMRRLFFRAAAARRRVVGERGQNQ